MNNVNSTLISLALLTGLVGCAKEDPGVAIEEYEDISDIPQPSNDLRDNNDDDEDETDDSEDDTADGEGAASGSTGDTDIDEPAVTQYYDFDSETSLLYVQVFKDSSALASAFAHNHVMRADNFYGEVAYNEDDASLCEISFSLPVADLRVDEGGMRELVGYDGTISSSDRNTIRGHMLDSDQLNGSSYPTISFESESCSGDGGKSGILTVQGGMTVRGRTANVTLPVQFEVNDGDFYAQASFDMNHAAFGMTPYRAFAGAVRNDDPLRFTFDLVGIGN